MASTSLLSLTRLSFSVAPALALAGVMALAVPAGAQQAPVVPPRTITMQGEAQAVAAPDLAVVSGGTQVQARTAREAMDGNSRIMRSVQQALKELGIEDRDISTSGLTLRPTIEYQQGTNRPRVVGYAAGHQLSVRIRDLAKLGDVLDRMVTAGANQMDNLQLTVSDWSRKVDEARATAICRCPPQGRRACRRSRRPDRPRHDDRGTCRWRAGRAPQGSACHGVPVGARRRLQLATRISACR